MEERTPQIRLIAGLGNPGPEYAATRHNIGFMVVEQLVAQFGSTWEKSPKWDALSAKCGAVLVVKPMSFMNRSGHPLFAIAQFYKIAAAEILVVLDDLALPLGRLRLSRRRLRRPQRPRVDHYSIRHRGDPALAHRHRRGAPGRIGRLRLEPFF